MKHTIWISLACLLIANLRGADPTVELVPDANDPTAIRLNLLESELGINTTIWKCVVPRGSISTFTLRSGNDPTPKLQFTLKGPREVHLFLSTARDKNDSNNNLSATFGHTGDADGESVGIYLGNTKEWGVSRGKPDSKGWRLFEISSPPGKKTLLWCEVTSKTDPR